MTSPPAEAAPHPPRRARAGPGAGPGPRGEGAATQTPPRNGCSGRARRIPAGTTPRGGGQGARSSPAERRCVPEGGTRASLRAGRSSQRRLEAIRAPAPVQREALVAAVDSPGAGAGKGQVFPVSWGGRRLACGGRGRLRGCPAGRMRAPPGHAHRARVRLSRVRRRAGASAPDPQTRPLILLRLHRGRGSGETGPPARLLRAGSGVQPVPVQGPVFPAGF